MEVGERRGAVDRIAWVVAVLAGVAGCGGTGTTTTPDPFVTLAIVHPLSPQYIAVDATTVYWTTDDQTAFNELQGAIMKLPRDGGGTPVVVTASVYVDGLAVDASSVYWSAGGRVMKTSLQGGTPVFITPPYLAPFSLAVDASNVYWVSRLDGMDDDSVQKSGLDGGTPIDLVTDTNISSVSIAVDANGVYWSGVTGVMKVGLEGGAAVELAQDGYPMAVKVHDGVVYWINFQGGTVAKVPAAGGTPVVLASGLDHPRALAVGSTGVYFATSTEIASVPLAGGAITNLVTGKELTDGFVNDMAVDETGVYWTIQGIQSAVRKLPFSALAAR